MATLLNIKGISALNITGIFAASVANGVTSFSVAAGGTSGGIQYNNGGVLGGSASTITAAGSINIPSGQAVAWNADSGISRLGAASLAIGNGTAANQSGTLTGASYIAQTFGAGTTTPTVISTRFSNGTVGSPTNPTALAQLGVVNFQCWVNNNYKTQGQILCSAGSGGVGSGNMTLSITDNLVTLTPVMFFYASGSGHQVNAIFGGTSNATGAPFEIQSLSTTAKIGLAPSQSGSHASYLYNDSTNMGLSSTGGTTGLKLIVALGAPDNALVISTGGAVTFAGTDAGISRLGAASLAIGNGTAADFTGSLKLTGLSVQGALTDGSASVGTSGQVLSSTGTKVKWVAGPSVSSSPNKLTNQTAAKSAVSLIASTTAAGMYRVSYVATVTTASGVGGVLGGTLGFQLTFVNGNGDSVTKTSNPTTPVVSAGNTTGTTISGCLCGYAAAASAITYSFDYTAGSGPAMAYDISVFVEYLGA